MGASAHSRQRVTAVLSLTAAICLCSLAACALFVPGFVFGAEMPAVIPTPQMPVVQPAVVAPSAGKVLVTLPWGSGEGQVGIARAEEGLTRGPEALAIAPDGRIAVLDSVNHRVLCLDQQGQLMVAAAVSLTEPRFLAVDNNRLYVLDCDADRRLSTFSRDGTALGTVALPQLPDVVTGLFATDEGACVEVAHDRVFLVAPAVRAMAETDPTDETTTDGTAVALASLSPLAGRPLEPDLGRVAKATFKPDQGLQIEFSFLEKGSLQATQTAEISPDIAPGRTLEHLVSVDSDGRDGLIVGARLLTSVPSRGGASSLILTRLPSARASATGVGAFLPGSPPPKNSFLLTESSYAYLGQPYVVAPDGRVFQPVGSDAGYSILVHSFATAETPVGPGEVQP